MRSSSFTLRFNDSVGIRVATRAVGTVLTSAHAPREVVDDVRLAVEVVLGASIDGTAPPAGDPDAADDGDPSDCVLGVACRPGRIGVEVRLPGRVDVDRTTLLALVDDVDVRPDQTATTVGLDRTWLAARSSGPAST